MAHVHHSSNRPQSNLTFPNCKVPRTAIDRLASFSTLLPTCVQYGGQHPQNKKGISSTAPPLNGRRSQMPRRPGAHGPERPTTGRFGSGSSKTRRCCALCRRVRACEIVPESYLLACAHVSSLCV
eukprot:6203138-Pleurochrysis_carterae.AAC.4